MRKKKIDFIINQLQNNLIYCSMCYQPCEKDIESYQLFSRRPIGDEAFLSDNTLFLYTKHKGAPREYSIDRLCLCHKCGIPIFDPRIHYSLKKFFHLYQFKGIFKSFFNKDDDYAKRYFYGLFYTIEFKIKLRLRQRLYGEKKTK